MRVLLDTQVLLWALMEPERLPAPLRNALSDPGHQVMFSAVNIWEITIKKSLRRPDFAFGPDEVLDAARATPLAELPVSAEHAARVLTLEPIHHDPFDRLLIAQALCENAHLLTADRVIARYPAMIDLMIPE